MAIVRNMWLCVDLCGPRRTDKRKPRTKVRSRDATVSHSVGLLSQMSVAMTRRWMLYDSRVNLPTVGTCLYFRERLTELGAISSAIRRGSTIPDNMALINTAQAGNRDNLRAGLRK
ncbi:hypothetical protein E4U34_007431 [Claviceps purpurea]|nr:hypothetical protein E4U34_007431 [Claviceps purpurea]KAG6245502.1 hypothetical protein E4U23_005344 [Claviceps purpurea]KAG6270345.1 hypothetical protein E4U48_003885 [Claviceps purpurea]KAG6312490.1 hypothetical protein E4U44_003298 [Claviceps purpurea]